MQFSIPRKRFAIIDALRVRGGDKVLSGALTGVLVAGERTRSRATADPHHGARTSGPLRARVELRGTYGNSFDYLVRLEAYAGQPFVRVWHTFIDRFQTPYVNLPRLSLELPLGALAPAQYRFGMVGAKPVSGTAGRRRATVAGRQRDASARRRRGAPAGWPAGSSSPGRTASVGLASRWFWQEYPQSITRAPRSTRLQLVGARGGAGQDRGRRRQDA